MSHRSLPLHVHRAAARAAALILLVAVAVPAAAVAQIGAFGGASSTPSIGDEAAHHGTPVLIESAAFPIAGAMGGSLQTSFTTGSVDSPGFAFEYGVTQTAASLYYAVSDAFVVGVSFQPWGQVSLSQGGVTESESGRGDAALYGKFRVWGSGDGRSTAAIAGAVGLPVSADGFGAEGVTLGITLAASRQLDGASLHAAAGVAIPTDEMDGDPVLSLGGGAMYRLGARASMGGELLARFSNGEYIADLAPTARFQISPRVVIDGAFLLNAATSLDEIYDGGLLLAVRVGR